MDKLKQEQDRIARLQAENHAALKAAQEGTEVDGWQTIERTPERQNMTKPEAVTQDLVDAITQDICDLDNNPFEGMADDDVWLSLNDLQVILARHLDEAIQAAEQRGMERERERDVGIAKTAWLQGGLNSPLDADEAQNLCEIIAQTIRQGEQA